MSEESGLGREIASFFLGGTFLLALKYIIQSRSFQPIQARFYGTQFQEQPRSSLSGFSSPSSSSTIDLILILTICIALASVSQFALNIPYDTGRGSAACAFFTAWAAVASQTTRTVALIQSALDTTYLGAHLEWRGVVLYGWLAIGLAFTFATGALNIGFITPPNGPSVGTCNHHRFLPTSIVPFVVHMVAEVYLMIKLIFLLAPEFLRLSHRLALILDTYFFRILSLFILDALTVVPSVRELNHLLDSIPFAVGAIIVLVAFNRRVGTFTSETAEITTRASTFSASASYPPHYGNPSMPSVAAQENRNLRPHRSPSKSNGLGHSEGILTGAASSVSSVEVHRGHGNASRTSSRRPRSESEASQGGADARPVAPFPSSEGSVPLYWMAPEKVYDAPAQTRSTTDCQVDWILRRKSVFPINSEPLSASCYPERPMILLSGERRQIVQQLEVTAAPDRSGASIHLWSGGPEAIGPSVRGLYTTVEEGGEGSGPTPSPLTPGSGPVTSTRRLKGPRPRPT